MERYQEARAQITANRLGQAVVDMAVARDALATAQAALEQVRDRLQDAGGHPTPGTYAAIKEGLDQQIWPSMGDAVARLQRARDHLATLAALVEPDPWPAE